MSPFAAMLFVWAIWAVSWFVAARWAAPAAKRVGLQTEWIYRAVTVVGAIFLFARFPSNFMKLWDTRDEAGWVFVGIAVLGFLFSWWARLYLGRLWSSSVTRKADHHIVDTGPYAFVRHPIYTGLILAALATAAQKGTLIAVAGAALMIIGFWIKARLEERFLREQLGAEAYDSYRRRVPMLVPFGPKST